MTRILGALVSLFIISLSAHAQVWPGRVATTQDVGWATDQYPDPPATLSSGIGATDLTIPVSDGTKFEQFNIVTIDKGASAEKILVCAVGASTLTVCPGGRGVGGSQAISHLTGAPVACRVNAQYYNSLAAEVLSIEANFAAQVVRDAPGGSATAFYQTIQSNTATPVLPQERLLNFIPGPNTAIQIQDDPGNASTDVVISALCASGGVGSEYQAVAVAGAATTPAPTLNFISPNSNLTIGAVFNSGANRTDLTFTVPSVSGSNNYQTVQANGTNLPIAPVLNFQGNGVTGTTVGGVTTVNFTGSTGTGPGITTSPNPPPNNDCHAGAVGAFWQQTGAVPQLWYCNQNGASYLWTQLVTSISPSSGQSQIVTSVKDLGATGNGSTNDTTAIQNAVNLCSSGAKQIYFPAGTYKITGTITVAYDGCSLVGAGRGVSIIDFEPTVANTAAILISRPSPSTNDIGYNAVRGLWVISSNTSLQKTALKLMAVTSFTLDDFRVNGSGTNSTFSGNNSVGIATYGHDNTSLSNLLIQADTPISIGVNPDGYGGIQLDMDHWHWTNVYLIANGQPCINVATGTVLTNVTFDGTQPWVFGTYGFYWETAAAPASYAIRFDNVRTEQGSSSTAESIHIVHTGGQTQHVILNNFQGDPNRRGVYLRGTLWAEIADASFAGSGVVLDADSSNAHLKVQRSYFNPSSTLGSGTTLPGYSSPIGGDGYVNVP